MNFNVKNRPSIFQYGVPLEVFEESCVPESSFCVPVFYVTGTRKVSILIKVPIRLFSFISQVFFFAFFLPNLMILNLIKTKSTKAL